MQVPALWKRANSLRFKLTLLYVLVFGLVQLGFWIVFDIVRTRESYRRFDEELMSHAQAVAYSIAVARDSGGAKQPSPRSQPADRPLEEIMAGALAPFETHDVFIQIRRPSGEVLAKTKNLQGVSLGLSVAGKSSLTTPVLESLPPATLAISESGEGMSVRLLTMYLKDRDEAGYFLQMAKSMETMNAFLSLVRARMFLVLMASALVAALISWHLVGRALAPIQAFVHEADTISASRMDRRIVVPHGDDEFAEMVVALNRMLDRLSVEFNNQQNFISNVSHELKTPLAVLLTEVRGLNEATSIDEYKTMALSTEAEVVRLLRIIDAFLLLTRATGVGGPAIRIRTPVEEIVLHAVKPCQSGAEALGIRLIPKLNFSEENPEPVVVGDSDLLYSMLENLIRNAKHHTSRGTDVEIEASTNSREAIIAVRDHGNGIPEDKLDRIFDLFYQITPEKKSGNLGIGLATAKSIAELHGGSITAQNRPGGGAEFIVRLPLFVAEPASSKSGVWNRNEISPNS